MEMRPSRGAFTVLATFLVLAISFDSAPILPSLPKVTRPAPDPRAIALVDELTGRARGATGKGGRGADLQVMRREDLDSALALKPQGFELWSGARERGAESAVVRK